MKFYGYREDNDSDTPEVLTEVTLVASPTTLRQLAEFLLHTAKLMEGTARALVTSTLHPKDATSQRSSWHARSSCPEEPARCIRLSESRQTPHVKMHSFSWVNR